MSTAIVWFRQDLRLIDNPALTEACHHHQNILPLYILDEQSSVLGEAQAWWLYHSLKALNDSLEKQLELTLILRKGHPLDIINELIASNTIDAIYWNRCYEPQNIARDTEIKNKIQDNNIMVKSFNGSLFHEPWQVYNKSGAYFKVFTAYWKTCRSMLKPRLIHHITQPYHSVDISSDILEDWRLLPSINWADQFGRFWTPGEIGAQKRLYDFIQTSLTGYKQNRDIPIKNATSRLSPHLHFGELSPWMIFNAIECAKHHPDCDLASAEHFLSELGWREFSYYLLYHFPTLPTNNFKKEFDAFPWHHHPSWLKRWQKGLTGYPIVDAGMRELWTTGYMHNRVRMIVASFLTKDLFIDWRLGAEWFFNTLLDADLANNCASWQWVAGCGADAAPYFRIFNPVLQSQKFDPTGAYIRQWIPELAFLDERSIHAPWETAAQTSVYQKTSYPKPIVEHNQARITALAYYQQLKKE